ncbi:plasmid partitioning protein RepB [Allorhizobium sp. BGMRC 0089]|uniref:plasmid partitioning protein RepB n=1 Tax=Allorhizobium sonneratiae TaxID=2934936 RepID=UPI002033C8DA|nr:plasmid partitioning protein RepB [Allorhizobium sonneratiae]MCM2294765.1 plasmid partitioning protein RepB [Allorhizobium sonneratiae]
MARKNPFAAVMGPENAQPAAPLPDMPVRGASKSLLNSIEELGSFADKLREGHTVIELDTSILDPSFVDDRMEDDAQEFEALFCAIRDHGQSTPILVRPHPQKSGRYMVVYGHRRWRVAEALGRKVLAVVKDLADAEHVIIQGQENSARANLSFIERALFAHRLARLHYDNDNSLVCQALSVDRAVLSKMLSVAAIDEDILAAIGPAKGIGRDRWYQLKLLLEKPAHLAAAQALIAEDGFRAADPDQRFERLVKHVKQSGKPAKAPRKAEKWATEDKRLVANMESDGKQFTLALKAKDAAGFGDYLSKNLPSLYEAYRKTTIDTKQE